MRVTSLLCGPWADLWPLMGCTVNRTPLTDVPPFKVSSHIRRFKRVSRPTLTVVCTHKRDVWYETGWSFAKAEISSKTFPDEIQTVEAGEPLISPPMVAALTRYSFPTLKLYFKTQLVKQANRNKTKRIDSKQSQATWSVAVLKISN